jgi:hypothetical protein
MEGLLRRELPLARATLVAVAHGDAVAFEFEVSEPDALPLVARLNEAGQGLLHWLDAG